MSNNDAKVIVALDYNDKSEALSFIQQVQPELCKLKIGKELFAAAGPDFVRQVVDSGFDVFLDLKYHDIPTTVRKAVTVSSDLGVWMLNVHALGGSEMIAAAREGIDASRYNPLLIAVTVLTSMNQNQIEALGFNDSVQELALKLGRMAVDSGADGLVCSAMEAQAMREVLGADATLVTPGIRPQGSATDDQQRIMTPSSAIAAGASYLVIGRPITQADDPVQVLESINTSLK